MATGTNEALGRRLRRAGRERPPAVPWAAVHVTPRNPDSRLARRTFTPRSTDDQMEASGFPEVTQIGRSRIAGPAAATWNSWPSVAPLPAGLMTRRAMSLKPSQPSENEPESAPLSDAPEKSFSWGLSELHLIRWRCREWARQWPALGTPRPGKQRRWHHL